MSFHTFTLNDKKLGFTLDKTKDTPTIGKITVGGAFEQELIEKCSTIAAGSEIHFIGEESVKGFTYEKAFLHIKSCTERPLRLVIYSPRKEYNQSGTMTVEEMNKASEEATKQGLRDLVKAIRDESESESEEEEDYVSTEKYEKSEKQIHLLKLDLQNAKIDAEDLEEELKRKIDPIQCVNDNLCHIKSMKKRYENMDKKEYTSKQVSEMLKKMNGEYSEYFKTCDEIVAKFELIEIKNCVQSYLKIDHEQMVELSKSYEKIILMKYVYETIKSFSLLASIAILVSATFMYK
tara:strand:+ start:334 stop:1209 length:876 start_codon:yes stop_codon:yes gene_type:complete